MIGLGIIALDSLTQFGRTRYIFCENGRRVSRFRDFQLEGNLIPLQTRPLNVEYLMMDESILLPPTGTPLTGIDFIKRLPSGELERTRRVSITYQPGPPPPLPSDL